MLAAAPVVDVQVPAVGLESGPALRPHQDRLAVAREDRLHVGRRIGGDPGRLAPGHRHRPDIVVGRPHLRVSVAPLGDEGDLSPVRRERERRILVVVRRAVEVARGEIARRSAGELGDEDMMPHLLPPVAPVPVGEPAQAMQLDRIPRHRVAHLGVAGVVHTLGIGVGDVGHPPPVGRDHQRGLHPAREAGDGANVAPRGIRQVHLGRSAPGRDEGDPAVGEEARGVVAAGTGDERPRTGRAVCRDHPDVGVALAGGGVGGGADEGDPLPVRRHLGIAHPDRGDQVGYRHGASARGLGRGGRESPGQEQEAGGGESNGCHGGRGGRGWDQR